VILIVTIGTVLIDFIHRRKIGPQRKAGHIEVIPSDVVETKTFLEKWAKRWMRLCTLGLSH
jgi:hypothetical protein